MSMHEILYESVVELFNTIVSEAEELDRIYLKHGINDYEPALVRYVLSAGEAYQRMKRTGRNVDYYALMAVMEGRYRDLHGELKSARDYDQAVGGDDE